MRSRIHLFCQVLLGLLLWLEWIGHSADAAMAGLHLYLHRPPAAPIERLDRPLRDRGPQRQLSSVLSQATVISLAKETMKEELGKAFRDYEVKSVVFDAGKKEWSVLFEPTAAPKPAGGCVTVFVDDETRETMLLHCR